MQQFKVILSGCFFVLSLISGSANGIYLEQQRRHVSENDINAPVTNTEYKYRTVQTGSALMYNHREKPFISPDQNKTTNYLSKIDTTIMTSPRRKVIKYVDNPPINRRVCVKCPPELTVVAQRRLDGVLIEPPTPVACGGPASPHNHFVQTSYEVQSLFGSNNFVLPAGSHSLYARIINKNTGLDERMCQLKYKVIVRECVPYRPHSRRVKAKCDLGSIWGSQCTLTCRNEARRYAGTMVYCNDDLEWIGREPPCGLSTRRSSCDLPLPPENGRFSCDLTRVSDNDVISIPSGSMCRVICDRFYQMSQVMSTYSTFRCFDGNWNSTMMEFCRTV